MGVAGQCHAPATSLPCMIWYALYRRLGGPQGCSGWCRKSCLHQVLYPKLFSLEQVTTLTMQFRPTRRFTGIYKVAKPEYCSVLQHARTHAHAHTHTHTHTQSKILILHSTHFVLSMVLCTFCKVLAKCLQKSKNGHFCNGVYPLPVGH
jgi:hypothetical protein